METIVSAAEQHRAIDRRWLVKLKTFVPWDYDVLAALYLPDVSKEAFAIIWQFYGIGSVIFLGVLVVFFLACLSAFGGARGRRDEPSRGTWRRVMPRKRLTGRRALFSRT